MPGHPLHTEKYRIARSTGRLVDNAFRFGGGNSYVGARLCAIRGDSRPLISSKKPLR